LDFEKIKTASRYIGFKEHPISETIGLYSSKLYLAVLTNLARLDIDGYEEKLVFIQWILSKSKLDIGMEELLKYAYQFNNSELDELPEYIVDDYRLYLVLDALLVANIKGTSNEDSYSYIANICAVLGMKTIQAEVMTRLAKVILEQTASAINVNGEEEIAKYTGKFKHYLPKEFIRRDRAMALYQNCRYTDFKWRVKQGSYVNKDQIIAVYGTRNIIASRDGILFQFKEGDYCYGVISNIFDHKDLAKEWTKQRR
jgi:hypothetical protein